MMRDWKTGLKMIRYAYQFKLNLAVAVMFIVLGVVGLYFKGAYLVTGGCWLLLGLSYMTQPMFNMIFAGSVAVSPKRKSLSLYTPDVITILAGVITYPVVVGISWSVRPENADDLLFRQFMLSAFVVMFLALVYMGVAYHLFILGTFLFGILTACGGMLSCIAINVLSLELEQIYVIGLVLIVAGVVLNCIERRLLYRRPLSKFALGAALRKRM